MAWLSAQKATAPRRRVIVNPTHEAWVNERRLAAGGGDGVAMVG